MKTKEKTKKAKDRMKGKIPTQRTLSTGETAVALCGQGVEGVGGEVSCCG